MPSILKESHPNLCLATWSFKKSFLFLSQHSRRRKLLPQCFRCYVAWVDIEHHRSNTQNGIRALDRCWKASSWNVETTRTVEQELISCMCARCTPQLAVFLTGIRSSVVLYFSLLQNPLAFFRVWKHIFSMSAPVRATLIKRLHYFLSKLLVST